MDIDTFLDIIDTARASAGPDKPFHEALVDHLATRTRQDILQYQERFDEVHAALYRWDVSVADPRAHRTTLNWPAVTRPGAAGAPPPRWLLITAPAGE